MTLIDYSSWHDPEPRRRGRRARAVLAVVVAMVLLVAVFAAFRLLAPRSGGAPRPPGGIELDKPSHRVLILPGRLSLGVCIDPTASITLSFAPAIRNDIAQALSNLAPSLGSLPTSVATKPQAAVDLTVRQVTTRSFSSVLTEFTRHFVIPGIPGLARGRPDPTVPNYDNELRAWYAGYGQVTAARKATAKAATRAAAAMAAVPLDRRGWSGISACISGLLNTIPASGMHSYLLASDLQENVASQLTGSFHGAPLVIVQTCQSGVAAYCESLLKHFLRLMHELGVGPVTVVRPEVAGPAINQWIRTGG